MTLLRPHRGSWITALALLALSLTSCAAAPSAATDGLDVAPEFRESWSHGGGLATYGPPISTPRREAGRVRQTFLAVEMVYQESASGGEVNLAPLGWALGLAEPAEPPIDGQGETYDSETGHTVYTGFEGLYDKLGGKAVVGGPISEVVFRDGQIVQYFENLGLYRPENASPAEARLIALGLTYRPPAGSFGLDTESVLLSGLIRERPFASFLAPHGGEALFGQPLTDPYLAEDGALEQVYERAVVYSPDGSEQGAALRPIGSWLGPAAESVPPAEAPGTIYFDETGHNVQWAFADFYRAHAGRRLFGLPLGESSLQGEVMVQRFENAVLTYRFDLPPALAVQLAPMGQAYLASRPAPIAEAVSPADVALPAAEGAEQDLQLAAALGAAVLAPGDEQTITLRVTRSDGSPVEGVPVVLEWIGRRSERKKTLVATDEDGRTSWSWRDSDASPGEIVNVLAGAKQGEAHGAALLQYAYGFPSNP